MPRLDLKCYEYLRLHDVENFAALRPGHDAKGCMEVGGC